VWGWKEEKGRGGDRGRGKILTVEKRERK